MKKYLVMFCAMIVLVAFSGLARATVLTFDELPGNYEPLSGYGGFNWSSDFWCLNGDTYPGTTGYTLGVVSHSNVAFNALSNDVYVTSGLPFTFNGAYFTSAWDSTLSIGIKGYSGANLLYSTTVTANNLGPVYALLDWAGVDRLDFTSNRGNQFVMDNFTYNNNAVPLPASLFLFVPGLLGIGVIRKRFMKKG